jgi:hypothetical protein
MDFFLTIILLVVAVVLVLLFLLAFIEVTSRVEIIVNDAAPLRESVLPNLSTLHAQYRRPLWLSLSSIIHSFSTLVKIRPDLPYRRYIALLLADDWR